MSSVWSGSVVVVVPVPVPVPPVVPVPPEVPPLPLPLLPALLSPAAVSASPPVEAGQAMPVTLQTSDWMPVKIWVPRPLTSRAVMMAATMAMNPAYSTAVCPSSRRQRISRDRENGRRSTRSSSASPYH